MHVSNSSFLTDNTYFFAKNPSVRRIGYATWRSSVLLENARFNSRIKFLLAEKLVSAYYGGVVYPECSADVNHKNIQLRENFAPARISCNYTSKRPGSPFFFLSRFRARKLYTRNFE